MMKLFAAFGSSSRRHAEATEDVRYTRFSCDKTREAAPQPTEKSRATRAPITPRLASQAASSAAYRNAPVIDENAHLYSDAHISVSVLQRALPERFAKHS